MRSHFWRAWLFLAAAGLISPLRADFPEVKPAQPVIPDRVFSLSDFGRAPAEGDASGLFATAIAAVEKAGGGTLNVPAGEYRVGPIELCSRLNFHLAANAHLLFSDKFADYWPNGDKERTKPLLSARDAHDVMISGSGIIDGNGAVWWQLQRDGYAAARQRHEGGFDSHRPHLVVFLRCQRVRIEGVTLTRSPMFHCVPTLSQDVTISGITIRSPLDSPNTDGIDPTESQRVLIEKCVIDDGDDCIALKAGKPDGLPVEDLLVTDCEFRHGHGCSIGSATRSGVRRITFRRCTFDSTDAGVRMKSNRFRGGVCEDVIYTDLTMKNVGVPLALDSYYPFPLESGLPGVPEHGQAVKSAPVTASTPIWRRITVRNITATGSRKSAGLIMGLPESLVQDVLFEHIKVEAPAGLRVGYADGVVLRDVSITVPSGDPVIIDDTVKNLTTSSTAASVRPPYPRSELIREIRWAPASAIIRQAEDSDCWPMTWGDDDRLYTAYGDGEGFEPFLPVKLSMGIAAVSGRPPTVQGVNLRSPTGEFTGNGNKGRKASGMLMVKGVLYLLARNLGNAQIASSSDHGATWTWADWKFSTSFGCPTFLNFGPNYAGARDRFVYVYSPDGADAYHPADRMVLARVPADRLLDQTAYEYFVGRSEDGALEWSADLARRGAVFTNPGHCLRGAVTFNSGLRRYLYCQVLPESADARGTRFQGGFGIYEAPEPWGPWKTVYYTTAWDVGPGDTNSFPTKWMAADGRSAWLVFSCRDSFSLRKAEFVLASDPS